jgi:hypothetical protein
VFKTLFAILLTVLLAGCQQSATKVLLGGTLRPSPDSVPMEDSIIVISGSTIRAVGLRKDVPVPQDSERTDMRGKWIVGAGAEPVTANQPANLRIYGEAPGPDSKPVRSMTMGVWDR